MSKSSDVHKLLKELEGRIDELPMHIYILIWCVSEMNERYEKNSANPEFNNINYPYTSVPLFNAEESKNLERLWKSNIHDNKDLFEEQAKPKKQSGGRLPKMSMSDAKNKMAQFGQAMNFAMQGIDPKKITPDYLYDYTTELFDTIDSRLTEASGNFGVVALESTLPDPKFIIPVIPPLPVVIPGRTIVPVLNAVLEALRITISIVFVVDPMGIGKISQSLLTLIMVLLDLGRGNLYHAIFTSFGFIGTTPMYVGIVLKILRDGIMLIAPDLRTQMRDLMFKSSKSFVLGYAIWLFTVLSPQFVKEPIQLLFDSVAAQIGVINDQLAAAEITANTGPLGAVAAIHMPRIPTNLIPDVNNLYALREAIRIPEIYCDPKIADMMNELRGVPPYALFFDLALIPKKGSPEYVEKCANFKGGSMSDNLSALLQPQIVPLGSEQPVNPIAVTATPRDIAKAAAPPTLPVSSTLSGVLPTNPLAALTAAAANPASVLTTAAANPAAVSAPNPAAALTTAASNPLAALTTAATNPAAALTSMGSSGLGALGAATTNPAALGALLVDPKSAMKDMAKEQMAQQAAKLGAAPGALGVLGKMASNPDAVSALAANPREAAAGMAKAQLTSRLDAAVPGATGLLGAVVSNPKLAPTASSTKGSAP